MAIRPPKYNSQGFTLIEMIATVMVAGILMAIATPSLLSLNKPLRDGSLQFKSQLSLIRSKAISSSKAYRIRPKFDTLTTANYPGGIVRNFVVEYADNCKKAENTTAVNWQMASQFDLDLPQNIGIVNDNAATAPLDADLNWTADATRICFDNRGIRDGSRTKIFLNDYQGFNKARLAELTLTKVGNIDIDTYVKSTSSYTKITPTNPDSPEF